MIEEAAEEQSLSFSFNPSNHSPPLALRPFQQAITWGAKEARRHFWSNASTPNGSLCPDVSPQLCSLPTSQTKVGVCPGLVFSLLKSFILITITIIFFSFFHFEGQLFSCSTGETLWEQQGRRGCAEGEEMRAMRCGETSATEKATTFPPRAFAVVWAAPLLES